MVDEDCTDATASLSCQLTFQFDLNLPPIGVGVGDVGCVYDNDELRLEHIPSLEKEEKEKNIWFFPSLVADMILPRFVLFLFIWSDDD